MENVLNAEGWGAEGGPLEIHLDSLVVRLNLKRWMGQKKSHGMFVPTGRGLKKSEGHVR